MANNDNRENGMEDNIEKPDKEIMPTAPNSVIEDIGKEIMLTASNHNTVPSKKDTFDTYRTLYLRNITKYITKSQIRNYFGVYGNIKGIVKRRSYEERNCSYFAFVVFETAEAVNIVTNINNHAINGEPIDVQILKVQQSKIIVNLCYEIEEEYLRAYFSKFGNIIKIDIPYDTETNERNGYCVVTYDSVEVADKVSETVIHIINGKEFFISQSLFIDLQTVTQRSQNCDRNSGKKQNPDNSNKVRCTQSRGKLKAQQNKEIRSRKNLIRSNFEGGQNINRTQNYYHRHSFDGGHNLYGIQNFNSNYNFDGRPSFRGGPNFDGRQNFRSHPQNFDRRQTFNRYFNEQTYAQFLHANNNSDVNYFRVQSSNVQNWNTGNHQHHSDNQIYGGNNTYQQDYWSNCATTSGGNVRNPYRGTNNNFGRRHVVQGNQGYNSDYQGNKFFDNYSPQYYDNYNNNSL